MIDEFIAEAARRTGLEIEAARRLTGRLLVMAEGGLGPDRLAAIADGIPGARATMRSADSSGYSASEVGGTVGGALAGRFGGEAGVTWIAQDMDLPEATVVEVARELIHFVERQVGPTAGRELGDGLFPPSIEEDETEDGEAS